MRSGREKMLFTELAQEYVIMSYASGSGDRG